MPSRLCLPLGHAIKLRRSVSFATWPTAGGRQGLDSLLRCGQVAGHLIPGLTVAEGDKDLTDAVALELDRDAESGPCLGQGFDCDVDGGPNGSVNATDAPCAGAGRGG
jgi:hypothetical protein